MKIKKPSNYKECKQIYKSHTLNEILPYLPKTSCFFDSRHWVCATLDEPMPFAVTTRINSNSQQYLLLYLDEMELKIKQATKQGYALVQEGGCFDMRYPTSQTRRGRVQGNKGDISPTLICSPQIYIYEGMEGREFIIRKMSPRETYRLMGVDEENIDKIFGTGLSDQALYKISGNSIVVNVLEDIFEQIFYPEEETLVLTP